jgi:hypothetical protein
MRIRRWALGLFLCLITVYLAGCGLSPKLDGQEITSAPNLITIRPSIAPTQFLLPTPVSTSTAAISTVDSTTTPTLSLPPTISPDLWYQAIIDILSSNGNCRLPCWWGVHPGESTLQSFNNVFYPIGYNELNKQGDFSEDFSISVNQINIPNLLMRMSFENNIVQRIYILADNINKPGDKVSHFDDFARAMEKYSLESILAHYGIPSRVYLEVYPKYEPTSPLIYALWVFYDDLGILIDYEGEGIVIQGELVKICPDYDKLYTMEFYLQSPQIKPFLSGFADEIQTFNEQVSQKSLLPLDKATTLTLEEFHNIFISEKQDKCFQSSRELWP